MILTAVNILLGLIFIYLSINNLYFFTFGLAAGLSGKQKTRANTERPSRIAVLIPAYKEDIVIRTVARKALEQAYPSDHYRVAVIADSLQKDTLDYLRSLDLETVVVEFEKSTKSKALRAGMDALGDTYDIAVVLDADNIMAPDFLAKVNQSYREGYEVIQGHRTAKNLDTHFAVLDAASEEINNSIFRKGHRALGLSSGMIGSGMAFDYALFRRFMADVHAIGGFDKELELKFNRAQYRIQYLNDAYVYDEKVQNKEAFENQRKRWLSAQIHYFKNYFPQACWHLIRYGNIAYFDKAYQMMQPPRVISLGGTALFWVLSGLYSYFWADQWPLPFASFLFWSISFALMVGALLFSLPKRMYNAQTGRAVLILPGAILSMFLLLFKLKGANEKFIHTPHKSNEEHLPKL